MAKKEEWKPDLPYGERGAFGSLLDYFGRLYLRQGWVDFLNSFNDFWCWFGTFTFGEVGHPESADRMFTIWLERLNRTIYGRRYYKHGRGVLVARCTELQMRGVLHYHALIAGIPEETRYTDFARWWQARAGSCDIRPFEVSQSGSSYLSKYIGKDGDLEIMGNTDLTGLLRRS